MNKEVFAPRELQPIKPLVVEQPRTWAEVGHMPETRQLAEVRREIALLPVVNVVVQSGKETPPPEPKTADDLLLMLLGAFLLWTGEVLESAEKSQNPSKT
jgi:hypothetical protein